MAQRECCGAAGLGQVAYCQGEVSAGEGLFVRQWRSGRNDIVGGVVVVDDLLQLPAIDGVEAAAVDDTVSDVDDAASAFGGGVANRDRVCLGGDRATTEGDGANGCGLGFVAHRKAIVFRL